MNYVEGMVTELSLLIQSLRQNFCIVYRGQASLQGVSKSTGGRQVYRGQASLQGASKSTGGRQVYKGQASSWFSLPNFIYNIIKSVIIYSLNLILNST